MEWALDSRALIAKLIMWLSTNYAHVVFRHHPAHCRSNSCWFLVGASFADSMQEMSAAVCVEGTRLGCLDAVCGAVSVEQSLCTLSGCLARGLRRQLVDLLWSLLHLE